MSIRIQTEDFDHGEEYQKLRNRGAQTGAIVTFCGLVRDFDGHDGQFLQLEYYPGMTEKSLTGIVDDAKKRWPIFDAYIIHRVGKLALGEQIVFVGVNSAHREGAFMACEFIMDFLKTRAPFWKKALTQQQAYWIAAKDSDRESAESWDQAHSR
ncbi:MAG: molybdopterin synthase catalytic subunit [Cellvibrionaceae bacterium]|jgi:molybdopterin synthase catalytic subunit